MAGAIEAHTTLVRKSRRQAKETAANTVNNIEDVPSGSELDADGSDQDLDGDAASYEAPEPLKPASKMSKKRKPVPDLDAIEDIQERRKQRRLAKNRATAAVSRERRRIHMIDLELQVEQLQQGNLCLAERLKSSEEEVQRLRALLISSPQGNLQGTTASVPPVEQSNIQQGKYQEAPKAALTAGSPPRAPPQGPGSAPSRATLPLVVAREPAFVTKAAPALAASLQLLCTKAPAPAQPALLALNTLLYFVCLVSKGARPGQSLLALLAPPVPSSQDDPSEECEVPLAWGWAMLLRLARQRQATATSSNETSITHAASWPLLWAIPSPRSSQLLDEGALWGPGPSQQPPGAPPSPLPSLDLPHRSSWMVAAVPDPICTMDSQWDVWRFLAPPSPAWDAAAPAARPLLELPSLHGPSHPVPEGVTPEGIATSSAACSEAGRPGLGDIVLAGREDISSRERRSPSALEPFNGAGAACGDGLHISPFTGHTPLAYNPLGKSWLHAKRPLGGRRACRLGAKLLPLGLALLAAEKFVQQRLTEPIIVSTAVAF